MLSRLCEILPDTKIWVKNLTAGIQIFGRDPFFKVQRGLRLRLRESHGLREDNLRGVLFNWDPASQVVIHNTQKSKLMCLDGIGRSTAL